MHNISLQVELQEVRSIGTTRDDEDDSGVNSRAVELELNTHAVQSEGNTYFDKNWWCEFDKVLKEHLEDLGIK